MHDDARRIGLDGHDQCARPTSITARRRPAASPISTSAARRCRPRSSAPSAFSRRRRRWPISSSGCWTKRTRDLIVAAADEVIAGKLDDHFPLVVWQTGSGTQSNMNVNEVISQPGHRNGRRRDGLEEAGPPQRPRQHEPVVQRHLSDRDAHRGGRGDRGLSVRRASSCCAIRWTEKSKQFMDVVKIGRTHLQDATPLTLGQEMSGWVAQIDLALAGDHGDAAAALRAGARRHGRRHRAQCASRNMARRSRPRSRR